MRIRCTLGRRSVATTLATVLAVAGVTLAGATGPAGAAPSQADATKNAPADVIGGHDYKLLADAEAKGTKDVTLIVATDKGQAPKVASALAKMGATIGKRVDRAGYVRARIATGSVVKAAKLPGVAAVDLDETLKLPTTRPTDAGTPVKAQAAPVAPPGASTPAANPFLPTNEIGAVSFKDQHPTWDGRGITIGVLDTGVDVDHPALQRTTTGERKIVDWFTATDPVQDGDGTWLPMRAAVNGPSFAAGGATWKAPAGAFRFNLFGEGATVGGEVNGDVNRDGDKTDRFGVLFNPATHDVRVDTNQNRDFTDDAVMRPYKEKYDIGHFGTDNPATAVRDRMPFVVEVREDIDVEPLGLPGTLDFVNIGIVSDTHGSHVAGIAAGNDLFGNPVFDGAAPGAKIVSARACMFAGGCTEAALTDGMVELVVERGVDVVNMSIGGLPALNDGNNAQTRLYDTLIQDFGVQMFISGGNDGPGTNTISDPSVATDVVSVAASVSKETWLSNYGSEVRRANNLFNFSARGPREDGGFKPNITAPGAAISASPLWLPGSAVPQVGYQLPPGYAMLNGTSMSSPQAAGAAALLLSAAKATKRGVGPAQLRRAIYSAASFDPTLPAHGQGNGMFNVPGAWQLIERGVEVRGFASDTTVCTVQSDLLATPDRGLGIHNRCGPAEGGHRPGQSKSYQIKVLRTTGPAKGVTHTLSWLGNDGTFSSGRNVVIPLKRPVTISVQAKPAAGVHSAILRLDDPATTGVDYEILNTVIASEDLGRAPFSASASGAVERASSVSTFVNVPVGAAALQVSLAGVAATSMTRFLAISPVGVPADETGGCHTNVPGTPDCDPTSRVYQDPIPGVWEIQVDARRTSPTMVNPFKITAEVQGVTVSPRVTHVPSAPIGQAVPVTWTATNAFGPVAVTPPGGPLGSAAAQRPSIAQGATQTFPISVPAGAVRLQVAIGNTSVPAADLDLVVKRDGVVVGQDADGDAEETVTIANPAAGAYTVEVKGFTVPGGTMTYDYRDVFFAPALGTLTVPSAVVSLASGASATVTGSVTANVTPVEGRELFGEMTLVTAAKAAVGKGIVVIGSPS